MWRQLLGDQGAHVVRVDADRVETAERERRVLGEPWRVHFALPGNGAPGQQATTYWFDYQDVRIAVLAAIVHDRCVEGICADYIGLQVPDRYVFGYGMDYKGYWRNADGIYAVRES